jgi:hypothetical protein
MRQVIIFTSLDLWLKLFGVLMPASNIMALTMRKHALKPSELINGPETYRKVTIFCRVKYAPVPWLNQLIYFIVMPGKKKISLLPSLACL